jgi:hypothetical protein
LVEQNTGPQDVEDLDLGALLGETRVGLTGSIGARLEMSFGDYEFKAYHHAYVTFDAIYDQAANNFGFDLHYFNVFFGASLADRIFAEIQIEVEHASEIGIRFAQVDVRIFDWLIARVGKFLVPVGIYNEHLYPEIFTKLPRGPLVLTHRHIIPAVWHEVGVQLRGQYSWKPKWGINYALFLVNGLQQDDDAETPQVEDGGRIRDMRKNLRDLSDSDKAFGGRVGVQLGMVGAGVSAYHGAYSADGEKRLTLLVADFELNWRALVWRTEAALLLQQATARNFTRWGIYTRMAYRVIPHLEPAVGFDMIRMDEGLQEDVYQVVFGINIYPMPRVVPAWIVRAAYALRRNRGDDVADDQVVLQMTIGY